MKKIIYTLVFLAFLVSFCNAQSMAGRYNVLDTSNGSTFERWKKTFDYSILANDSNMSATSLTPSGMSLAIGSGEIWQYDFYATDSVSAVTGIKFGYAIPSGAVIRGCESGSKPSQDSTNKGLITAGGTAGAAFTLYIPTTNYGLYEAHFLVVNGSTPGNVVPEYEKPTSGKAVLKANSILIGHRVN